jgi:methionyl aminopeptidase
MDLRVEGVLLKSGMTLAIEPMINLGTPDVKVLEDGWTTVTRDQIRLRISSIRF